MRVVERLADMIEKGELFLRDNRPPDMRDVNSSTMYRISAHDNQIIVDALRACAALQKSRLFDFQFNRKQI